MDVIGRAQPMLDAIIEPISDLSTVAAQTVIEWIGVLWWLALTFLFQSGLRARFRALTARCCPTPPLRRYALSAARQNADGRLHEGCVPPVRVGYLEIVLARTLPMLFRGTGNRGPSLPSKLSRRFANSIHPQLRRCLSETTRANTLILNGETMYRIKSSIEVACDARSAYDLWNQSAKAQGGNEELENAQASGQDERADERVLDKRIVWRSLSGAKNAGTVRFELLGSDRTRVHLVIEYESERALEEAGDSLDIVRDRMENTLGNFKGFIEQREVWAARRGKIPDRRKASPQSWTPGNHPLRRATDRRDDRPNG